MENWSRKNPKTAGYVAASLSIYGDPLLTEDLPSMDSLPSESFLLRVHSDGPDGLSSGDYLIVDPRLIPKNGDLVVAMLNNRVLVKRFEDVLDHAFKIIGVVLGLYENNFSS